MCWGVGTAVEKSIGGKGDIRNIFNNTEFFLKKNKKERNRAVSKVVFKMQLNK